MNTKVVRMEVGALTFSAKLPVASSPGFPGKEMVAAADVARFEKAVADWLIGHGIETPESLRHLRSVAGLTGAQLAELLDVDRARVSEWENGKAHPGHALYATIATLARESMRGSTETADYLRAMLAPKDKEKTIEIAL